MNYINYAREILGNKRVNELIKEYNLCTKKWTYGRSKTFFDRLKKECKLKQKEVSNDNNN